MKEKTMRALAVLLLTSLVACSSSPADSAAEGEPADDAAGGAATTADAGRGGGAGRADAGGTGGKSAAGGSAESGAAGSVGVGGQVAPTPEAKWVDVTGDFASAGSADASLIAASPYADLLVVNIWQQGLWGSTDGAQTWKELGSVGNGAVMILFDPASPATFWESGMYGPAVYRTTDGGKTLAELAGIQHVDVMSVDFTDPARKTLLAGGHEQSQVLYQSLDGGESWGDVGPAVPDGTNFSSYPLILDTQTYLVGCSGWGSGTSGIYRSTDAGTTFTQASKEAAVGRPLVASDKTIYWGTVWDSGFVKSTDGGKTWSRIVSGNKLQQLTFVELPDGRLVAASKTSLMISADKAATWNPVADPLPFELNSMVGYSTFTYSTQRRAFYVVQNKGHKIMRYGFDYQTK
jgi:photosystem II stability/assembly factor-like uncharacterized protein